MKIGVAFSGSGAGAGAAHLFAGELRKNAVAIDMLSATSLTAVPLLFWSRGMETEEITELMTLFHTAQTPTLGLKQFEKMGLFKKQKRNDPLAISSVDTTTGVTVIYSDTLKSDAWNLKIIPLSGEEYQALAGTLSPYRGCEPRLRDEMRLCDFAIRYGCPFFPLKMAGMERILSVSFCGGNTPAQIAADSLSALTGRNACLHYDVKLDNITDCQKEMERFVQEHLSEIYEKMLF